MNPVRLTKKGIAFMIVILVLLSAGLGYGLWVINYQQNLSSTDTGAAGTGNPNTCDYKPSDCTACNNKGMACNCNSNGKGVKCVCNGTIGPDGKCSVTSNRYHCCDGTWSIGESGDKACKGKGYGNCDKKSQVCSCKSYGTCGTGCTFPAGTQAEVNRRAASSCGSVMAFCVIDASGNTKVTYGDPGSCDPSVCNNPIAKSTCAVNTCEGGGLISPTNAQPFTNGDKVTFKGYAFDADGIDNAKINVSVDGTVVGQATAVDACGANGDATICSQHAGKKPVVWSYTYTATGGTHTLAAAWQDTKGLTGGTCRTTTSITGSVVQDNWVVTKVGAPICVNDDPENITARVNYTITIRNSASTSKNISKIVDTLDAKVLSSYILTSTINPTATVDGRVITWNLTGTGATFAAGQSKTYRYSLEVPESAFGTYSNTVVVTPEAGSNIQIDNSTVVGCTPTTGILDSSIARVGLGLILIGFGFAYLYSDSFQKFVTNTLGKVTNPIFNEEVKTDIRRRKFEKKVVNK
jgi:hypothetical protein